MKSIYAIALACVLGSTAALAEQGGEGNNTGCQGQGNPNSPCEPSNGNGGSGGNGGNGGAGGSSTNENTNTNLSNSTSTSGSESEATAVSGSHSSSNSNASGGSVRSDIDVSGGESSSSSTAVAGDSYANTGDSTSNAEGGTAVASGGKSSSDSGGNSLSTSYVAESSAASAASVFAGYCQTGGSGQTSAGGFSVVNPEQFCNHIRMAAVYQEAFTWEMKNGSVQCVEPMGGKWVVDGQYEDHCVNEKAAEYLASYREHIELADDQLEATEVVSKVDAFFGYLVRPLGVLALLLLL